MANGSVKTRENSQTSTHRVPAMWKYGIFMQCATTMLRRNFLLSVKNISSCKISYGHTILPWDGNILHQSLPAGDTI